MIRSKHEHLEDMTLAALAAHACCMPCLLSLGESAQTLVLAVFTDRLRDELGRRARVRAGMEELE